MLGIRLTADARRLKALAPRPLQDSVDCCVVRAW